MSDSNKTPQNFPRRILRLPEVMHCTGYKRSSIYKFIADGTFPKSRKLGIGPRARATGWDSHEVQTWIDARLSDED